MAAADKDDLGGVAKLLDHPITRTVVLPLLLLALTLWLESKLSPLTTQIGLMREQISDVHVSIRALTAATNGHTVNQTEYVAKLAAAEARILRLEAVVDGRRR